MLLARLGAAGMDIAVVEIADGLLQRETAALALTGHARGWFDGFLFAAADAMGADAIVFTAGSVDPHNGKCVRSAAGSLFHLPIVAEASAAEVIGACRTAGLALVTADAHASESLGSAVEFLRQPVARVFGSEAHGLSEAWREASHRSLRIPMAADVESLNLAASAAICLYATAQARSIRGT